MKNIIIIMVLAVGAVPACGQTASSANNALTRPDAARMQTGNSAVESKDTTGTAAHPATSADKAEQRQQRAKAKAVSGKKAAKMRQERAHQSKQPDSKQH